MHCGVNLFRHVHRHPDDGVQCVLATIHHAVITALLLVVASDESRCDGCCCLHDVCLGRCFVGCTTHRLCHRITVRCMDMNLNRHFCCSCSLQRISGSLAVPPYAHSLNAHKFSLVVIADLDLSGMPRSTCL